MLTSTGDMLENHQFLLSTLPPNRRQQRFAACVLAILICALILTAPFARVPLSNTEVLLPAYAAAIFVNELITSALLLGLFSIQRSPAIVVLAIGYLFSGLLVVPWVLTFPNVFAALHLPDVGLQSTAWFAALRRLGFPLFVLAYALLKNSDLATRNSYGSVRRTILGSVAGTFIIVCGLTWLIVTSEDMLPRFMRDEKHISGLWQYIPATAVLLYVAGLVILRTRLRSVLDLWLMIVLCTLLIETVLLAYFSAGLRFSAGWWAGRLFGLTSASVVLLVLVSETTTLYAQLARSMAAERRTREARLTAMEALSASIAHEINQPLASMVTNADAGLRWLGNNNPDLEETRAALARIVSDGHRAGKVIDGIRTMFRKGAQERVPLNMNRLIEEVLRRSQHEVQLAHVVIHTDLDEQLPRVTGNPVQLQQVVSNLVENAIDAMSSVTDQPRVLLIEYQRQDADNVLVSVKDSGSGLNPQDSDRLFEPFFTTKPDGMGMGLMFCRSIIEAHGGRLWATDNVPQGAVFQFTLPCYERSLVPAAGGDEP
jgi:signal transduction histidine kinase